LGLYHVCHFIGAVDIRQLGDWRDAPCPGQALPLSISNSCCGRIQETRAC
jgi:hypothetical protein